MVGLRFVDSRWDCRAACFGIAKTRWLTRFEFPAPQFFVLIVRCARKCIDIPAIEPLRLSQTIFLPGLPLVWRMGKWRPCYWNRGRRNACICPEFRTIFRYLDLGRFRPWESKGARHLMRVPIADGSRNHKVPGTHCGWIQESQGARHLWGRCLGLKSDGDFALGTEWGKAGICPLISDDFSISGSILSLEWEGARH